MKLSNVAAPRGQQTLCGLANIGWALLAVLANPVALAEDPTKTAVAPAKPAAADAAPSAKHAPASERTQGDAIKATATEPTTGTVAAATKPAPTAKPAPAKPVPAVPAECVRTGQRVIAALARDDTGAASQFFAFYNSFKCPPPHLAQAFGCLVNLQTVNPGLANPTQEQVAQCWTDPATPPKVIPPPPPPPQQ
ncbi:MAG: hypothetical protein ACKN9T_06720 [Candidatus Methylumidiphilus sp.]